MNRKHLAERKSKYNTCYAVTAAAGGGRTSCPDVLPDVCNVHKTPCRKSFKPPLSGHRSSGARLPQVLLLFGSFVSEETSVLSWCVRQQRAVSFT